MGLPKRSSSRAAESDPGQAKKQRGDTDAPAGRQRGKRRRNDEETSPDPTPGDGPASQSTKRSKDDSNGKCQGNGHGDKEAAVAPLQNGASSSSPKGDKMQHGKQNGCEPAASASGGAKASGFKEDVRDASPMKRGLVRKTSFRDSLRESEGDGRVAERKSGGSFSIRTRGDDAGVRKGGGRRKASRGTEIEGARDLGMWQFTSYLLTEAVSADNPDTCSDEAGNPHQQAPPSKVAIWDQIPPFMQVPMKLEATLSVGLMICADSFLFNFTLLPLRTASGLLSYLLWLWSHLLGKDGGRVRSCAQEDMVRAALLVLSVAGLHLVDISYLYHYIRGQMSSYIKLYVIFNVLEVLDKLFCSLGQDVFDKMAMWSQEGGRSYRSAIDAIFLVIFLIMAFVYVLLHSTVLLVQVVTLNVAINSQNNALFTLLVANNFTELKGQVFKKFEENTLLQLMCADIVERFQLAVFLGLVTLQNLSEEAGGWDNAWLQDWATMVFIVWFTEHVVDWIKHSFVTKFNKIDPSVYNRYRAVIWEHTCNAWRLRQPHRVARHVGFVSLPLACVVARVGSHSLSPTSKRYLNTHWKALLPLGVVWWTVLCLFKIQMYLLLLGHACQKHQAAEEEEEQERERERERELESLKPSKETSSTGRASTPSLSHQPAPSPSTQEVAPPTSSVGAVPLSNLMGVEMFVRAPKGQVDPAQVPTGQPYPTPPIRHMPSPHDVHKDSGGSFSMPKLTL